MRAILLGLVLFLTPQLIMTGHHRGAGGPANPCGGPIPGAVFCLPMNTTVDGTGAVFHELASGDNVTVATPANFAWSPAGFSTNVPTFSSSPAGAEAASATPTNFDGSSPFTIALWITRNTAFSNITYISTINLASNLQGWDFGDASSLLNFSLVSSVPGGNYINVQATTTITSGSPQCIVVTWNPDVPTVGAKKAAGVTFYQGTSVIPNSALSDTLTGSAVGGTPPFIGQRSNGTQPATSLAETAIFIYPFLLPATGPNSVASFCASTP
jgi:hypothetical protein